MWCKGSTANPSSCGRTGKQHYQGVDAPGGHHLGQMIHQQVRACATRFNAYTNHNGKCTHHQCRDETETNEHVVAHCPRYANARAAFNNKTGLTLCGATYTSIMALDHKKLQVQAATLAKALCEFLARVAQEHTQKNKTEQNASVAVPLGGNQGRVGAPVDGLCCRRCDSSLR